MAQEGTKVQSEPKAQTAEDFLKAYQLLCEKFSFQLVITPSWIARDDGTWSTKLQVSVGQLPKQQEEE